ncbi:small integral membrane protein 24 isoform X2 [Malaclemys terrapin pileata]|uniref:small integral membrane protein 24 isoform X2 n=1 Tax=Malaclemys terrapin pileata TaxID=2991368 RepID=UPI0023A7E0D2|nr:small integral membrane protein 24 isoform X2 [Malaclemys terrapin pileata]
MRLDIGRTGGMDARRPATYSATNGRQAKRHTLGCLYTNARSLGNKMEELELLVQELKPDIVGITETWWNGSHDWNTGMRRSRWENLPNPAIRSPTSTTT